MKIASFNINGVKARLPALLDWLRDAHADVVVLQELKATDDQVPRLEIEDMGYNLETHGQKGFNGVAILSKLPIEDVRRGLPGDETDEQARWIEASVAGVRVCGLYLPNGNPAPGPKYDYKLAWMDRLQARAARADRGRGDRRDPRRLQRHPRAKGLLGPARLGPRRALPAPSPAPPSAASRTSA